LNASVFISSTLHSEQESGETFHFSFAGRIISGPNHGPCVDVNQFASGPRRVMIALASMKARVLATVHALGNGAIIPRGNLPRMCERGTTYTTGYRDGR
jgi:hypothetical protein